MKRVQVYYNLHKHVWSVKDKKTGRVIAHLDNILLTNCKFIVRQGGREKVLREKAKNVHAFVEGDWDLDSGRYSLPAACTEVTYNPYKYDSFVRKVNQSKIETCGKVYMENRRVWAFERED